MLETDKIIFTGPVGAGKTTAISAISDVAPVSTDVAATDSTRTLKSKTTVGLDYSYITVGDDKRIHLYGTPGQERFSFMWKILARGGIGLVLLIPNDHPDPIGKLEFYMDAFDSFIKETGVVIGITRVGVNDNANLGDYQAKLFERNQVYPVFEVDARSGNDVSILINALLAILM
ncbi:ATP/GTP-binding protein [Pseudomonadota bacterium]